VGIIEIIKGKKTFPIGEKEIIPLLHPAGTNNGNINECREEIEYILRKIRNLIHNQLSM